MGHLPGWAGGPFVLRRRVCTQTPGERERDRTWVGRNVGRNGVAPLHRWRKPRLAVWPLAENPRGGGLGSPLIWTGCCLTIMVLCGWIG